MRRALALAAALLAACVPARPGLPPRHILLVTFDGLRADRLSCYAGPRPTSSLPNDDLERLEGRALALDDLSAAGVTFAHACAPSALTLPSLATLFTGLAPVATGVLDERSRLPLDVPTLAELARAAGFYSAAFVSRPGLDVLGAVGRGFENAQGFQSDGEALAAARDWLDQHDFGDGRQVLLWIHLSGLEPPWRAIPAAHIARPEMQPLRFVDPAYHGPADGSAEFFARVQRGTPPLEPADRAALEALYDGRIAAVTGQLTTFLQDAVDFNRRGAEVTEFWARTLLVVTATHGFDLGQRGGRLGAELCDDFLRVPLILRHPDSITGERVLQPVVELADVLPTIVELFDLPRPRVLPGRSLLGLTDAHPAQPFEPRSAISQGPERSLSLRDGRWRMVWNPYRSRLPENDPGRARPLLALYDHALGSSASADVAAQHPEVVERLQQEVKDWTTHQTYRPSLPLAPSQGAEPRGN